MNANAPADADRLPISATQSRNLAIALTRALGNDDDARHAWISERVGRTITHQSELTDPEALRLIDEARSLPKHEHDSSPKPRRTAEEIAGTQRSAGIHDDGAAPVEAQSGLVTEIPRDGRGVLVPPGVEVAYIATPAAAPPVQEAVRRVMEDIGKIGVGKDGYNETQRYNFRGIDDFVNRLSPILSKHGVILLPNVGEPIVTEHATKGGGKQFMLVVRVKWRIVGPAGDTLKAVTLGQAMDTSDKAGNKAMSAAYKYALGQVFAIPNIGWAEGDNDHPEAVADPLPPAQPSEEERQERWAVLARINARATEIGKTFEEFTAAQRARIGGMSVEEFRNGPISGLRGYIERVDAYLAQQAAEEAARPVEGDEPAPGQDPNDA